MADPGNRERGLRAAISNPRVSEKAKQRDREILANEFGEEVETSQPETSKSTSTSSGIKKSSSTGPHSSSGIEESSDTSGTFHPSQTYGRKTRSASSGESGTGISSSSTARTEIAGEGKDMGNVIRGLKAAITNPNVSEKAKERDRKKLQELGE
ncbi:Conidiation protein 6-domain-containing protein [Podospora australis]|uniref:Conidiation protein 6-domain-containing protein n=1 Tax=Podospora australis TaxID=1536484 RepID=A0AAN6WSR3_9PEZI|nr:Conidiation protein 6-domain-containing protein [Podospora australis]